MIFIFIYISETLLDLYIQLVDPDTDQDPDGSVINWPPRYGFVNQNYGTASDRNNYGSTTHGTKKKQTTLFVLKLELAPPPIPVSLYSDLSAFACN
jgi:hypothetical protein